MSIQQAFMGYRKGMKPTRRMFFKENKKTKNIQNAVKDNMKVWVASPSYGIVV